MAWKAKWFKGASRASDFKLYHYLAAGGLDMFAYPHHTKLVI
jgi:hypothetical protein